LPGFCEEKMKIKSVMVLSFIAITTLFASGCFSIEQEIFLNPDGSGELVLHVSLPDFPEIMKNPPPGAKGDPEQTLQKFKTDLTSGLPPELKLKEIKEVRQNGAYGFYAVFQFKQLKDVEAVLQNFGKQGLKGGEISGDTPPQWTLRASKQGNVTAFTQSILVDLSSPKKEEKPAAEKPKDDSAKPQEPVKQADEFNQLQEQLEPLILSMIKMRFVLHAPSPIADSNADIVLNGKTVVWNCSLVAFLKNKKPIEMKASF
jgi:hypothetical protein